ncbi:hypothetical protein ABEB36_001569 [Hypothenemus hampei]|uniref:Transmembrane protein n=1 Tax=Hypothenemus hampei TaxID=57062 RepID=A0ABD1FEZ5_HYPHA
MVELDESKENFIVDMEDVEVQLREEERRRTGRYLAIMVVLFLIGIALYQIMSHVATSASAWISAAVIMFLYLLWLWYAAYRRKRKQKNEDLKVEKEITTVLGNQNNLKSMGVEGHENMMFSNSEDEIIKKNVGKARNKIVLKKCNSMECCRTIYENSFDDSCGIFIRTYSVG